MNLSHVVTRSAPHPKTHRQRCDQEMQIPVGAPLQPRHLKQPLWLTLLLGVLMLTGPGWAATPASSANGTTPESRSAATRSEALSEQSVELAVTEVRRLMERGWWTEARARLDQLPSAAQADPSTPLALLRAEICYQQRDLPCAVDSLEQARNKATPEDAARVAQVQRYVQERVGALEIHLQQLGPLELIQDAPCLDIHLQKLFDETQRTLKRLRPIPAGTQGKRPPLQGVRWRHFGTRTVLESPPPGPVIAEVWLPLGHYRIQGISVELVPGLSRAVSIPLATVPSRHLGVTLLAGARLDSPSGELLPRQTRPTIELRIPLGPMRLELGAGLARVQADEGALELGYPNAQVTSPLFQVGLGWAMHAIDAGPVRVEFSPTALGLVSWTSGQFHPCGLEATDGTTLDTGSCITTDLGWSVQGGLSVQAGLRGWQLRLLAAGGFYDAAPLEPEVSTAEGQWNFEPPPERGQLFSIGLSVGRSFGGRSFGGRATRTPAGGQP